MGAKRATHNGRCCALCLAFFFFCVGLACIFAGIAEASHEQPWLIGTIIYSVIGGVYLRNALIRQATSCSQAENYQRLLKQNEGKPGSEVRITVHRKVCGKRWFTTNGFPVHMMWITGNNGQVTCALDLGHAGPHDPQIGEWR